MKNSSAFGWISSTILSAGLLLVGLLVGDPVWLSGLATIGGIAFAVAAGVGLIDWIACKWLSLLMDYRRSSAVSERVALLDRISRMDEQQLDFAKRYVPRIEMASGDAGPALFLRVINDTIPLDFVREFIAAGDSEHLCPIRVYSDGSLERKWAEAFTSWTIWMGYAAEADGNRPARWIRREVAMIALGLT